MAGCGASFSRVVLVIVNVIFMLLGLGIAIAGLVFKYGSDVLQDDITKVFEQIDIDMVGGVKLSALIESLSNFFIVVGFIIFGIGFFGFCGACCKWKWMLVIYAIVVILLLIAQIAAIALFASFIGKIDDEFSGEARKLLSDKYGKDNDTTQGFDKLFETFKCCGIGNYTDVKTNLNDLPKECCSGSPCTSQNVYPGCFSKLEDEFDKYNAAFIGVGVAIIVFQVLCIIFAFCVCRSSDDD